MRRAKSVHVDRGRYEDAVTPWEQETWWTEALGWVKGELAARGLRATGEWQVRLRPWSVLVRVPVEGRDAVRFKGEPAGRRLRRRAHGGAGPLDAGARPGAARRRRRARLVVAARRRRALQRRTRPRGRRARCVKDFLRQYADMQRTLIPYAQDIEQLAPCVGARVRPGRPGRHPPPPRPPPGPAPGTPDSLSPRSQEHTAHAHRAGRNTGRRCPTAPALDAGPVCGIPSPVPPGAFQCGGEGQPHTVRRRRRAPYATDE